MDDGIRGKHILYIFLIVFILRLPAFWTPILDVDESQFAGFANVLLAGGRPYIDSLDTKPLGIYYFFAAIFWLFGKNNMIAVHLVTALWVGVTAIFCYRIADKLYSQRAGLIAALFYAVFTTTYIPKFISTSIVIVMMLPLTVSIDAFLSWDKNGKQRFLWLSGVMWGIACLFKYQAGINLIVMVVYLLIARPLFLGRRTLVTNIKALLIFVLGGVFVGTLFAVYLHTIGVWDDFVLWSLKGSTAYINAARDNINFWPRLAMRGGAVVASAFVLWFFAVKRCIRISTREETLVLLWFLFTIIPVCTGGRFYGHYFLQLYPALCVLAAGGVMDFLKWINSGSITQVKRWAYGFFVIGITVPAIIFFAARVYSDQIYARIPGDENPKAYVPIADYIKKHTAEDDKIFVWGFATPIYIFADRPPASRFLWSDWMTGRIPGTTGTQSTAMDTTEYATKGSWALFFEDMNKNTPEIFVDTSPGNYHDYGPYPVSRYPKLMRFLEDNYTIETSIDGADIYRRK